jgi:hypothetical protein
LSSHFIVRPAMKSRTARSLEPSLSR